MAAHWTQQVAKSLSTGRGSPAVEAHLDALLLWLSNPEHPRAADLDRAIGRRHLSRRAAARRAFQILDGLLFDGPEGAADLALGLPDDADPANIKRRYRRLVQVYHPDRHPERTNWATRRTDLLNRAFDAHRKGSVRGAARAKAHPGARPKSGASWIEGLVALRDWLDRRWPTGPGSLTRRILEISRTRKALVVGALGCLALLVIIALLPDEPPNRPPPRVIHHPLGEAPKRPAAAHTDQADKAPQRSLSATAPKQTEEAQQTTSTDAKPAPKPPMAKAPEPKARQDRPSTVAPADRQGETEEEAEKAPTLTTEPSPDVASPVAQEPLDATGRVSASDRDASRPTESPERASTTPVEPQPSAAPQIDAEAPPVSAVPPRGGNISSVPHAPKLNIPPIEPPPPPQAPTAPKLPLQIGAAEIATPAVPAVTNAPADCGAVPELLRSFQRYYQAGILDRFMALYSPHAKENDLPNWFAIRQTYADWFSKTSARRITFEQLQVEPTTRDDRCAAIALFQVSYLDAQSLLVTKAGVIQLLLEQDGGGLRILRARY